MREIKFRAWDKIDKITRSVSCFNFFDELVNLDENSSGNYVQRKITDLIISQFTGLKDKNGKDVYEGDLLKIDGTVVPVEYKNGAFIVRFFSIPAQSPLGHFDETDIEIIGNIYENTELLNQ